MRATFNTNRLSKTVGGVVEYSIGFLDGAKGNAKRLSKSVAELSIEAFYDYLDGLARSHPGMLHHVYEWGQVGDPSGRLVELKTEMSARNTTVSADFLQSDSVSENSNEPFYNKAEIMEEGIPVVINEVRAKALFFTIEGQEFFRTGPIVIANPGGAATRGSFVKAFDEFYGQYFEEVFLRSIRFYDKLRNPQEYSKSIKSATKGQNAYGLGKRAALSWIEKAVK
jgi:hypothetical protein